MKIYLRGWLITKTTIISVVVMSMFGCGTEEPGESTATNVADSGNLPVLVLEHFEKYFGEMEDEGGELLPAVDVSIETKDMDNDGKPELFLYNSYMCGSGGCSGPVYSEKSDDGSYCFVAMGDSLDFADDSIVLEPLACRDYEKDEPVHLGEMKKFRRPQS